MIFWVTAEKVLVEKVLVRWLKKSAAEKSFILVGRGKVDCRHPFAPGAREERKESGA